jgi:hypothetical protein
MSTVRFVEHNGERIALDGKHETHELRCDLCGEFIEQEDALQLSIEFSRGGGLLAEPIRLDAHPSCARQLGERISQAIDQRLAAQL